jgi:hypothetical protein
LNVGIKAQAEMREFPVENSGDFLLLLEKISDPVIAMHDGPARRQRTILLKPTAAPIQQRVISRRRPRQRCTPDPDGANLSSRFARDI